MTMDELRALAESHQSRLLSNPFLELLHTLAILSFLNLRLLIFFLFLLHVLTGILIAVRGGNSRAKHTAGITMVSLAILRYCLIIFISILFDRFADFFAEDQV
jgi:hypothetical protein